MKSEAIPAVGVALVDLPFAIEPHPLLWKPRAKMECGAGSTLARYAVAQVNSIRIARGNYSKRAAVALAGPFHRSPPSLWGHNLRKQPTGLGDTSCGIF